MDAIRGAGISVGVDPLGGAGVHYWGPIAERYGLDLTVVNEAVDPTFRFMTVDWDGQIRMDPSSPYAMQRLIDLKDRFDDRRRVRHRPRPAWHRDAQRRAAAAESLSVGGHLTISSQHRPAWRRDAAVGKTVVSSQMIDRVAAKLGRGSTRCRSGSSGSWTACSTARSASPARRAPARRFCVRTAASGPRTRTASSRRCSRRRSPRVWAAIPARFTASSRASSASRSTIASRRRRLRAEGACWSSSRRSDVRATRSGRRTDPGHPHLARRATAQPIGGVKVIAESGWFAARPSGTENIYKIYAESFRGADHLRRILNEAQRIVDDALAAGPEQTRPDTSASTKT